MRPSDGRIATEYSPQSRTRDLRMPRCAPPHAATATPATSSATSILIELDVPVEEVAPRIGRAVHVDGHGQHAGQAVGAPRRTQEAHARLLRRPASLAPVAV